MLTRLAPTNRYRTKGHAERPHSRLLVRLQGCPLRADCAAPPVGGKKGIGLKKFVMYWLVYLGGWIGQDESIHVSCRPEHDEQKSDA